MTVKKQTRCGGFATVVARQRLQNSNQQIDPATISKPAVHNYNITVGFNDKDQLQLTTKDEASKTDTHDKSTLIQEYNENINAKNEKIKIDDIENCVNVENYTNCANTLVFYVTRNAIQEAIAVKFENEQDFKRIYFTYKYFKMRNRLTKNNSNYASSENLFTKKKVYNDTLKIRKSSIDNYDKGNRNDFNLMKTTDNNGVTHISVQQKRINSKFDQPLSLMGIRTQPEDLGEIDSIIYTDDPPMKPYRKNLFQKLKPKAPPPPAVVKDNQKVLKGQFLRVNVDKVPDVVPKESKVSKVPDILMMRENKSRVKTTPTNVWAMNSKGAGYDSDREEWRSRSQFSTSAFDSLARPTKMAMAFTLRKPLPRTDILPQYYRLPDSKINAYPRPPNNFLQRPPRLPRPPEIKRNPLNHDHRKFTSLQHLDIPKKLSNEPSKPPEVKKLSQISTRISGLTNKLKDLGSNNTFGRLKTNEVANLKPVIKKNVTEGGKRPVVRTCSAEPPKKVTFSAFATVQVV